MSILTGGVGEASTGKSKSQESQTILTSILSRLQDEAE